MTRNGKTILNNLYDLFAEKHNVGELYWCFSIDDLGIQPESLNLTFKAIAELDTLGFLRLAYSDEGSVCVMSTQPGWRKWKGWKPDTILAVMSGEVGQDWQPDEAEALTLAEAEAVRKALLVHENAEAIKTKPA